MVLRFAAVSAAALLLLVSLGSVPALLRAA